VFDYLEAAALAGTVVDLLMLDATSDESGAQGPRMFCQLFTFNLSQELEGAEEVEFVAKPTYHEISGAITPPDWHAIP
jgi:hypothetical protein